LEPKKNIQPIVIEPTMAAKTPSVIKGDDFANTESEDTSLADCINESIGVAMTVAVTASDGVTASDVITVSDGFTASKGFAASDGFTAFDRFAKEPKPDNGTSSFFGSVI